MADAVSSSLRNKMSALMFFLVGTMAGAQSGDPAGRRSIREGADGRGMPSALAVLVLVGLVPAPPAPIAVHQDASRRRWTCGRPVFTCPTTTAQSGPHGSPDVARTRAAGGIAMAGQHRRRPGTSPALLRADDHTPPSSPPRAANDAEVAIPVREIRDMDLSADPRESPVARRSRVRTALRAEILCRGLHLSQSKFTRRYGPPSAIVRNWAPLTARSGGDKA